MHISQEIYTLNNGCGEGGVSRDVVVCPGIVHNPQQRGDLHNTTADVSLVVNELSDSEDTISVVDVKENKVILKLSDNQADLEECQFPSYIKC